MPERIRGKTLIARDEGDAANGVAIKLYGGEVVRATPGCWVLKPRRIPYTMWNAGSEPAHIIELYTPGGFERFFTDFGERMHQGPIRLDELNRLGEPDGIRFFDDWIADLKAAYNLRLISE